MFFAKDKVCYPGEARVEFSQVKTRFQKEASFHLVNIVIFERSREKK